jgi:hypothetical protein
MPAAVTPSRSPTASGTSSPRISGPARRRTRSNIPEYTTDELILALDVYMGRCGHIPSPRDADILELSYLLNRLPIHTVRSDLAKFLRSSNLLSSATLLGKELANPSPEPAQLSAGLRFDCLDKNSIQGSVEIRIY